MDSSASPAIWAGSPFWKTPFKAWREGITENFLSHAAMIHAFAKAVAARKQRAGSIAVLSGAGVGNAGDFSHVTSYSTSKAALVHLVEALAPGTKHARDHAERRRAGRRLQPHDRTSAARR